MLLSMDTFEVISDWNHYAILELMKIKDFKSDIKWISKILALPIAEVRVCVERLERVGILEILPNGKWVDKSEGFSTHVLNENYTSYAHQQMQIQILTGAINAMKNIAIEERDQSSMMMATSKKKIKEAKKRIQEFRRSLCEFLEDEPNKDAVYQLGISLYPIATVENIK